MRWIQVDVAKSPYITLARADLHVLGYGAISGFACGLWQTHSLPAAFIFAMFGSVCSGAIIILSKMADGPGFIKLHHYLENLLRVLILAIPVYFVVKLAFMSEWILGMIVTWWFFLPLVYLTWQGWASKGEDDTSEADQSYSK